MKLKFTNIIKKMKLKKETMKATMKQKIEDIKKRKEEKLQRKQVIIQHEIHEPDTEFSIEFGSLESSESYEELFQPRYCITLENCDNYFSESDFSDNDIELSV